MHLPRFLAESWARVSRDVRAALAPRDALALAAMLGVAVVPRDWPSPAAQDGADIVTRVAAAEAAFAKEVAAKGTQDGFLAFIADSGVILAPGGTVSRAMMASAPKQPADGGSLLWHPTPSSRATPYRPARGSLPSRL